MDNIFLTPLLLSLIGLIAGLIKPQWVRMSSRKSVGYTFASFAVLFFALTGLTAPSTSKPVATSSAVSIATNTDMTTQDVYTTVAGQTVYQLKNRYAGDFYIALDGVQQSIGVDQQDDPKTHQTLYSDNGPFIRFTNDPGNGHILKVYESSAPVVASSRLASDYAANQIAADAKYKDKVIKVSGTVGTIGKDILDTPYIAFQASDPYAIVGIVQCMFDSSAEPQLANIKKGQEVTLEGQVKGETGNILIENCSIF